ncbi:MAG TPA: hypothetical protein DCS43_07660 [Verrucomicrobia bacterium]|nr:hypothetical protein [Verrucomicrobiota bacterium]
MSTSKSTGLDVGLEPQGIGMDQLGIAHHRLRLGLTVDDIPEVVESAMDKMLTDQPSGFCKIGEYTIDRHGDLGVEPYINHWNTQLRGHGHQTGGSLGKDPVIGRRLRRLQLVGGEGR